MPSRGASPAEEPFLPGQQLRIDRCMPDPASLAVVRARAQAAAHEGAAHRSCRAAVPARAGLMVCDMREFAPGTPGGGGAGLALHLFTEGVAQVLPRGSAAHAVHSSRAPVVEHHLHGFCALLQLEGVHFEVHTFGGFEAHSGLGSTSSAALAALAACNACLGCPLSMEQLRLLVGHNYVEECGEERVGWIRFGWETGMTGMAAAGGGAFLLSKDLVTVYRSRTFAEGKSVLVVVPAAQKQAVPAEETALLLRGAASDDEVAAHKAHTLLMHLVPALEHGNVAEAGRLVWEMQRAGSKQVEIRAFPGLWDFMQSVKETSCADLVAMSSIGPSTLLILDADKKDVARQLADKYACSVRYDTAVDSVGLRLLPPRLVIVAGPPGAGKTTLCTLLAEERGPLVQAVPASALIRELMASERDSEEAVALKSIMEQGRVADTPAGTTTTLVMKRLAALQAAAAEAAAAEPTAPRSALTALLDGFPRTVAQAIAFERRMGLAGGPPSAPTGAGAASGGAGASRVSVLFLQCGPDTCVRRMTARAHEAAPAVPARLASDESAALLLYFRSVPHLYDVHILSADNGTQAVRADALKSLRL